MDNNYPTFPEDSNKPEVPQGPSENPQPRQPVSETQASKKAELNLTPPPDNYLVWAILSTVLCCMPIGIVSIVKSSQVNTKWLIGDHEGALKDAKAARNWALWSAISWAIMIVLYFAFILIIQFFAWSTSSTRIDYY